jgi:hypothetical protein
MYKISGDINLLSINILDYFLFFYFFLIIILLFLIFVIHIIHNYGLKS